MWLNKASINHALIMKYKVTLLNACPHHIVIDDLFDKTKLNEVVKVLQAPQGWQTQKHTYNALYVSNQQWQNASKSERFVKRDIWQRELAHCVEVNATMAQDFLSFLRKDEFMHLLSSIFDEQLTDINVARPALNTNYFRLNANDFVRKHADDSPGRVVCMLLYLNNDWRDTDGGELVFLGDDGNTVNIAPLFNRCVLFDPSSTGAEHWVNTVKATSSHPYRYNVTSWYWSE